MSFSKAKIQRFNDIKECTPSPAKYNVCLQEKIKLGIISKAEAQKQNVCSSKNSDAGSVHSTPCFQTPTVPLKRKKLLGISFQRAKTPAKHTEEELRDRIVECTNKDLYIQDLVDQIEELTTTVTKLKTEKNGAEGALLELQQQHMEERLQSAKKYEILDKNVKVLSADLQNIRQFQFGEAAKILAHLKDLEEVHNRIKEQHIFELEQQQQKLLDMKSQKDALTHIIEELKHKHTQELEEVGNQLQDSEAKIRLLQENLNDVTVLTQLQTKEKLEEIETTWKQKLEDQNKEAAAILKECQEISEYNIIQSEIEKNHFKKLSEELQESNTTLEKELTNLKTEKHAYELSISTFKDTIEVLKRRLINSDRDVEQLKAELERCEDRILKYEQKCDDLTTQLTQTQLANEELEMQYESTSKIMQDQVETVQTGLLRKVDGLLEQCHQSKCDKGLLRDLADCCHQQQVLLDESNAVIAASAANIDSLERRQSELETELKICRSKLEQETEEGADIRRKYIETSGKYDALAQQFEQILQELDGAKAKIQELEVVVTPYRRQVEAYEKEVDELRQKYADLLGHQNHGQKIRHLVDLKTRSSELFNKNVDLEASNQKLNKTVEKLVKELDELRKLRRNKNVENKENVPSPKCAKSTQSPGPLKAKN